MSQAAQEEREAVSPWPDLQKPQIVERTIRVSGLKGEDGPVPRALKLSVLVDKALYLVWEDEQGLRAGQVVSRNLELTRTLELDPDDPEQQVFVVYDSIFDAWRAFSRINPKYKTVEIPELRQWITDADWLMRQSWTLDQATEQDQADFVLRVTTRVARHKKDTNEKKVAARERTHKVASPKDSKGRVNYGRIPLLCTGVSGGLAKRTQAVRGIGRRMDWRAVVIEHFLDQLREQCLLLRRHAHESLVSRTFFGQGSRDPARMRILAQRMEDYVNTLALFRARPFTRRFNHSIRELREAARLLRQSADERNGEQADRAREELAKIYRSMCVFECHWRLESALMTVCEAYHRRRPLSQDQVDGLKLELEEVLKDFEQPDTLTKQPLEAGFARPDTVEKARTSTRFALMLLRGSVVSIKLLREVLKTGVEGL